jgi:hypothetical protein
MMAILVFTSITSYVSMVVCVRGTPFFRWRRNGCRSLSATVFPYLSNVTLKPFCPIILCSALYIVRQCRKDSLTPPQIKVYDTKIIYSKYAGDEKPGLKNIKEWIGTEFENHKASEDAKACFFILKKILGIEGKERKMGIDSPVIGCRYSFILMRK